MMKSGALLGRGPLLQAAVLAVGRRSTVAFVQQTRLRSSLGAAAAVRANVKPPTRLDSGFGGAQLGYPGSWRRCGGVIRQWGVRNSPSSISIRASSSGSSRSSSSTSEQAPLGLAATGGEGEDENPEAQEPEDGITRYPSMRSSQGLLRGLDYLGTVVFALSGSVTAGLAHMDILGCTIVGTITAVGGGTVRDLLLGNRPVFWMEETEYGWMCVVTAVITFFAWGYVVDHGFTDDALLLRVVDALGVGAFCVIGAQNAVRKGMSAAIAIGCGCITATFGGVIRDVLCGKPPRILHSESEVYATTAMAGSSTYVLLRHLGCSPYVKIWGGFFAAVATRYIAWRWDVRLPTWARSDDPLEPDASFPGVVGADGMEANTWVEGGRSPTRRNRGGPLPSSSPPPLPPPATRK